MTATERKKLAKAARELAYLYAEGMGPILEPRSWCGCAAGQLLKRARLPNKPDQLLMMPARDLDDDLDGILTEATSTECGCPTWGEPPLPGAVVFALLWAADELESAP